MPYPNWPPSERGTTDGAFDRFFVRYARELAAVLALATGDVGAAEDAIQEGMAHAFNDWKRVARMDRPDLWVLRVAHRRAINSWRKSRREIPIEESFTSPNQPDPINQLWVRWGLERLTPDDRMLVILRHRDGLSVDEIATALGKRSNTVAIYLKRARRRLRGILKETDQ